MEKGVPMDKSGLVASWMRQDGLWSGNKESIQTKLISNLFPCTWQTRRIFIGIAIAIVIAYFLTVLSAYRYRLEKQDFIGIVIGTPKKVIGYSSVFFTLIKMYPKGNGSTVKLAVLLATFARVKE